MTFEHAGRGGLDYAPCRYGRARLVFRGPRTRLDQPYIAFLGGTETYGRYVAAPFPALLGRALGTGALNLGCINAGPDVWLNDHEILDLAAGGRAVVVQLGGVQNLSNRFYTVHPRRNDRFLRASPLMQQMFRDVDFTEFHFTGHMLASLRRFAPDRFNLVVQEVRAAWIARMTLLLARFDGRAVLLRLASVAPQAAGVADAGDPLAVTTDMLAELRKRAAAIVEVGGSAAALAEGTAGMIFGPGDSQAACGLPNPRLHAEIAAALAPELRRLSLRG